MERSSSAGWSCGISAPPRRRPLPASSVTPREVTTAGPTGAGWGGGCSRVTCGVWCAGPASRHAAMIEDSELPPSGMSALDERIEAFDLDLFSFVNIQATADDGRSLLGLH